MNDRVTEIYNQLLSSGLGEKYSRAGIYSISIGERLVYIGKAKDMLVRIANHINEMESNQKSNKYKVLRQARQQGHQINFDVVYYSPCLLEEDILEDIGNKEGEYIRQLRPCLNYQIPKAANYRQFTVNRQAKYIQLHEIIG